MMNRRTLRTALAGIVTAGALVLGMASTPALAAGTASIKGTVTVPVGIAPWTVMVTVYASDDPTVPRSEAEVNADGSFSADGLLAGSYKVFFQDGDGFLASQWWQGATDFADATTVTLSPGGTATASPALTEGASISGTVTGLTAAPDSTVCAYRVTANTGEEQCGMPSSTGTYTIGGLRSGDYKIRFSPELEYREATWNGDYLDSVSRSIWWNDQPGFVTASVLSLAAAEAKTGVNEDVRTTGGKATWPTITGTPRVAQALTATPGVWPAGTQLRYSWFSTDGRWSANTTVSKITLPASVVGKTIGLTVWGNTGSVEDGTFDGTTAVWQAQEVRMATKVAAGTLTASTPTVSGIAAVGLTLTAKRGSWTAGTAFSYAWYANGVYISGTFGATHSTFKLTSAQKGKQISVKVIGTKSGYATATRISARTAKVALTALPTITGVKRVGYALTAHPGTWTAGTRFAYRWYANGIAITGATHATFKLTSAQRGKTIKVAVTGVLSGYATVTRVSAATTKVL